MDLGSYQERAAQTDQVDWSDSEQRPVLLLGVIGELGSVVSELKKSRRDRDAYSGFAAHFREELGDLLWYLAALARHAGTRFREIELKGSQWPGGVKGLISLGEVLTKIVARMEPEGLRSQDLGPEFARALSLMEAAAREQGTTLGEIGEGNLEKTVGRWGGDRYTPAHIYDATYPEEERLPRKASIQFLERRHGDRSTIVLRANGITVGDRLTDNAYQDDGYRFHDAFHLAHAALLGWSPVTRALFRCKRKSNGRVDEVEDGARAQIAEEMLSFQVFTYASDRGFLAGLKSVDHDLLTGVSTLVRGLEVSKRASWEWELAFLQGYEVFRQLREHCGGWVSFDADERKIQFDRPN